MPKYKIFLLFCLAFIAGIGLTSFFKISFFICYLLFLFSLIFLVLGWRNKKIMVIGLSLIFIILGILRYSLSWPKVTPEEIQFYNGEKITLQGIVKKVDERLDRKELFIESKNLIFDEKLIQVKGKVLVFTSLYSEYQYGDKLEINCQLSEPKPIEKFAYHEYLARDDIYSVCWPKEIKILERNKGNFLVSQIFKIREKIKFAINKNFTEPEGSVLSALFLGLQKEISPEVRNWFATTGTAHILAISGLHIVILVEILFNFLVGFLLIPRRWAFYLVIFFLIFFIILTGAPASAVRASLMGFLVLLAQQIGRKKQGINLIILAALLMLLFNPKLLKSDIGFQLSFSAVLGITFLKPHFRRLFNFLKFLPQKLKIQNSLATTLSAYLFSLPLVLYYFGNLSLSAPLTNILILPILPILMSLAFVFAVGSLIYLGLAQILFWPAWLLLRYLLWLVKNLAQIPYLSFNFGRVSFIIVVFLYLFIIIFIFKVRKIQNEQFS